MRQQSLIHRNSRWGLSFTEIAAIFLFIALVQLPLSTYARPNIVFVMVDDFGFNDVGYNSYIGGNQIPTPNIDALARQGVIIRNFYSEPVCGPSRSSVLTGLLPQQHCNYINNFGICHYGLRVGIPTIAERLRDAGDYNTAAVGKWHIGHRTWDQTPLYRGFNRHYGAFTAMQDHYTHLHDDGGYDLIDDRTPHWEATGEYSTTLFTDESIRIIQSHADSQTTSPLFLYLAYTGVHNPLQAPDRYVTQCSHIPTDVDERRQKLCSMVVAVDEGLGQIVKALQDARQPDGVSMWNNTVFILASDNGGPLSEAQTRSNNYPLRGEKSEQWEGGINVNSFVVAPPGLITAPAREDNTTLMHFADWYPTMMHLAGIPLDPEIDIVDGVNQWDAIAHGRPSARTQLISIWASNRANETHYVYPYGTRWMRDQTWKLLVNPNMTSVTVPPPENPAFAEKIGRRVHVNYNNQIVLPARNISDELELAYQRTVGHPPPAYVLLETYYLVNLVNDKSETTNLASEFPDRVADMRAAIAMEEDNAVPACTGSDPACELVDGAVLPWA